MPDTTYKKIGRIEVKHLYINEQESDFQIFHRGHQVATYKISWKFEGDVDDLDLEVVGQASLTSLQNSLRLADDVGCSLRLDRQMEKAEAILNYFLISPVSGVPTRQRSELSDLFLEDEFLKRIKEDGPLALRNHRIQTSLNTLIKRGDKRTGETIRGIFEALLDYAKVTKLPGTRGNVKFKSLGKPVVKRRYKELDEILRIVKKNVSTRKRWPLKNDIRGLMFDARKQYYEGEGINFEELPKDSDDRPLDWSIVSDLLVNDEVFEKEFLSFTYEPDKFAIRIISKLLGYTPDTMDKFI